MENIHETVENIPTKEEAVRRVSRMTRDLSEKGERVWEDSVDLVRRHPAAAVGGAALAGLALGALAGALLPERESSYSRRIPKLAQAGQEGWNSMRRILDKGLESLKDTVDEVRSLLR